MNLTCPNPDSISPLQTGGFILTIDKLPEISFFAQETSIPSITLPNASQATPFTDTRLAGDKITFGSLDIRFLIDEKMKNYIAVDSWIRGLGFPESRTEYQSFRQKWLDRQNGLSQLAVMSSDGSLFIIGSNQKPVKTIRFSSLVPVSLSGLPMMTNYSEPSPMSASVSFEYTLYSFIDS